MKKINTLNIKFIFLILNVYCTLLNILKNYSNMLCFYRYWITDKYSLVVKVQEKNFETLFVPISDHYYIIFKSVPYTSARKLLQKSNV